MVGSLILIGGMGGLGLIAAHRLNREVTQLEEIAYGLNVLSKEITYGHTRLPRALQNASSNLTSVIGNVFSITGRSITEQELSPQQAFRAAISEAKSWEAEAAIPVLLRLADELGTSSCQEQERFIKLATEEIRAQQARASAKAASQGKVYRWGGFLVGTMLTLLLI